MLSPDGTKVAFLSGSDDFGPTDTNRVEDLYVRDLLAGTTQLVSVNRSGTDSGDHAAEEGFVFGPDSSRLAFSTLATNIGPVVATPGSQQIYLRDLTANTTSLVTSDDTGTDNGNGLSWFPSFSPDGTKVAFTSDASNFGPNDGNGARDVYVRDLTTAETSLVSADSSGADSGNGQAELTFHLSDRRTPPADQVLFRTLANDTGTTDTNNTWDVYLATPKP